MGLSKYQQSSNLDCRQLFKPYQMKTRTKSTKREPGHSILKQTSSRGRLSALFQRPAWNTRFPYASSTKWHKNHHRSHFLIASFPSFCCRILVRAISYTVHGLIPASCVFADRYNREEVVRSLGKEVNLNPPLTLGQLPDTPEELLKLDQVSSYLSCKMR